MQLITVDFETFYSKDYSLTKMTTEQYIRGDLFEVIGVAVKVDDGETKWCSGDHDKIAAFLSKFDWANSMALAHNAMFDAAILSWVFGIKPKAIADTLSMARALHGTEVGGSLKALTEFYGVGVKGDEVINALGKHRVSFSPDELKRYAQYCINDVDITYKLFEQMMQVFPPLELRLIDITIKMFSDPVFDLDTILLTQHLQEVRAHKEELLASVHVTREDLASNKKFVEVLKQLGVEAPTKKSITTGKQTYALAKSDEGFKRLPEQFPEDSPLRAVVEALVAARLGVKSTLEETRTERFLEIANRGKLPIPLRYYAAHTGRWGGSDKVNLQNLPSRGANANKLKQAIKAPRGYVVIESDSAQIEARVLAWLAEQDDLVHAFATGKDVYKQMASVIYQKDESTITKEERFVGKSVILGAGYGMGAVKFKAQLHAFGTEIGAGEAENIIAAYRRRFPNIVNLWDQGGNCLEALLTMTTTRFGRDGVLPLNPILGGFVSPVGFVHAYPGLQREPALPNMHEYTYKTRAGRTKIYGGKVVENLTQHLARCIVGEQMVRISKRYRVVMTVHDSIVCIAPKEDEDKAKEFVERCMRWAPDWAIGVPLNCEVGSGASYGDC